MRRKLLPPDEFPHEFRCPLQAPILPAFTLSRRATFFIRAADKRHVEGSDLDMLNRGQNAVDATRHALKHGRGNIRSDPWLASTRTTTLREVTFPDAMHKLQPGSRAAISGVVAGVASFLGAGNCGEHMHLSAVIAGKTMKPDEKVHLVRHETIDHEWSTLSRNLNTVTSSDVVMDAWAEGPAVFAEDSRLSNPDGANITKSFGPNSTKIATAMANVTIMFLNRTTSSKAEVLKWRAVGWTRTEPTLDATSVIDQRKGRLVLDTSNALKKLPLVMTRGGIKSDTLMSRLNCFDPPHKLGDNKVELRKEVLAAGVTSSLGANVSDAAKVAPKIIKEAARLADWKSATEV